MTPNKSVISEEMLENLAFTRSTWWSEFFESFSVREEGEVYVVDELDEKFIDDSLDEEEMENFEEAEEVDVPEDIEHRSLLNSITLNEQKSLIESSEFQDILNATLPVLEEHERKWKNAGLESILNTFDSVRIKKEVGEWIRRNRSVTTTGRELEICSSPSEGRFSRATIQDTLNPRYGKKETIDTPTKSITQQRIDKRIPIYIPQQKQQTSDSSFEVTRELLSSVIGEEKARRFFKYNLGAVIFPITSTVYYCPPEEELSSSDSDDDPLEKVGRCGEMNESVQHN